MDQASRQSEMSGHGPVDLGSLTLCVERKRKNENAHSAAKAGAKLTSLMRQPHMRHDVAYLIRHDASHLHRESCCTVRLS